MISTHVTMFTHSDFRPIVSSVFILNQPIKVPVIHEEKGDLRALCVRRAFMHYLCHIKPMRDVQKEFFFATLSDIWEATAN